MTSLFTNYEESICPLISRVVRNRLGTELQRDDRNFGKAWENCPDLAPRPPGSLIGSGLYGSDHG